MGSNAAKRWHDALDREGMQVRTAPGLSGIATALAFSFAQALPAAAAQSNVSGSVALALAGVMAAHSPALDARDKETIAKLFGGRRDAAYPAGKTIAIAADQVICRVSNVDLMARSCELAFWARKVTLRGRIANELFATLAAAGVTAEGAAGSQIAGITMLACTIDPNEIKQASGGGAGCTYASGQ